MEAYRERKNTAVMRESLSLAGARAIDVGCGDGAMVRFLTREGARTIGIECSEAQLVRARIALRAGDEGYLKAFGEALPFKDGSLDIVVYLNSLHHVAVEAQPAALDEAARVLKPGGHLFVMEPLAEGAYFELMKPVEDETLVRAKATEAIAAAARGRFTQVREERYAAPFKHESFETWKTSVLAVNPARHSALEAMEGDLRVAFEARATKRDGAYHFAQPIRANLLRRG